MRDWPIQAYENEFLCELTNFKDFHVIFAVVSYRMLYPMNRTL